MPESPARSRRSPSIRTLALRILLAVYGAFWIVGGAFVLNGTLDLGLSEGVGIMGTLMVGNGIAGLLGSILSARGNTVIDIATLAYLAVNLVLSVADEVGAYDVIDLVICAVAFGLLVLERRAVRAEPVEELHESVPTA